MPYSLPQADCAYPITLPNGQVHRNTVQLCAVIRHPNFQVGAGTYADDFDPPPQDGWATRLAPYLYEGAPGRLIIGKFCQIANGVRFITSGANHVTRALTTYPFPSFDPSEMLTYCPDQRDTVIGHDVWLGFGAMVTPGARIGNGVIVGAGAVVRGELPDYAVVTGNPAQVVRMRFPPEQIARLNALAWWDWPADRIVAARPALEAGDVAALDRFATQGVSPP